MKSCEPHEAHTVPQCPKNAQSERPMKGCEPHEASPLEHLFNYKSSLTIFIFTFFPFTIS